MILSIIGIVLSIIAIGLIFHFRKEYKMSIHFLEGESEAAEHGYTALMKDFTNYQVETDRKIAELEKQLITKTGSSYREIDKLRKELPTIIGRVVGQIEFAQDRVNKQK
jgi:hypothetical protein